MAVIDNSFSLKIENISRKIVDDSIKINAAAASNSGLDVKVSRFYDGIGLHNRKSDCQWCLERQGNSMTYQEAFDKGAFQRHVGCGCIIEYVSKKGERTYQLNKSGPDKWLSEKEFFNRINYGIDKKLEELYNNSPARITIGKLREIYAEDVANGWISALSGFDNYFKLYTKIETEIIGRQSINGVTITGQSRHFLQRVIGTGRDPKLYSVEHRIIKRSGVRVEDIKQAIFEGTPLSIKTKSGEPSQVFLGLKCKVSINPERGLLIQCNPR